MTLQDLFDNIAGDPTPSIIFFIAIPIITAIFAWIGHGETSKSPWKYIYSSLVYLSTVPGVFAITLCIYTFLFLRINFLEVNILVYFLPIISMIATLLILQKVTNLDQIPGFDKISGLLIAITVIIAFMFVLDRTRILAIAFINIPIQFVVISFIVLLLLFRFGMKRLFKR